MRKHITQTIPQTNETPVMNEEVLPSRFVRYKDGAKAYCMCQSTFEKHAKAAGAVIKLGKIALVDCNILEKYLAQHRVKAE